MRSELGLSQQKMADESGTVQEMIAVIENRKKHPQINTLIKTLEPFGIKNKKSIILVLLILKG